MKKRVLSLLFTAIVSIIAIAALCIYRNHCYVTAEGNPALSSEFADMKAKHLNAAMSLGFPGAPLNDGEGIEKVDGLERVKSCTNFKVNRMSHGLPYLTHSAKEELVQIARDFRDSCRARKISPARLIVTSLLRSQKDVQELRRINSNAVENSSHLYGTSFDLSWANYQCADRRVDGDEYLKLLSSVLRRHRDEGLVFIRYETNQRCFHITVNKQ